MSRWPSTTWSAIFHHGAFSVVLAFFVLTSCYGQAQIKMRPAPTAEQKRELQIEQWKQDLNKKGIGENSKWDARLQDGRKVKGYLSEIREDGFTLVDSKTEESSRIAFSEVSWLKRQGMRWYTKVAIAGAVVGAALGAAAYAVSQADLS